MRILAFAEEGYLLAFDLPTDRVRQLAQESGAPASTTLVITISEQGTSLFVNATPLPHVSAVDVVADVQDTQLQTVDLRLLNPGYVANSPKLSSKVRSQAPQYAELLRKLRTINGVSLTLVDPEIQTAPPPAPTTPESGKIEGNSDG